MTVVHEQNFYKRPGHYCCWPGCCRTTARILVLLRGRRFLYCVECRKRVEETA